MNAPKRRLVKFNSPDQVITEIDQLQKTGYRKAGSWTLPQACRHVALTIEMNLTPPANSDAPTAEQLAAKNGFFGMVMDPAGMPAGRPTGPTLVPPETCGEEEIHHLKSAFKTLADYPHAHIVVGKCGPVPTNEVRLLHYFHAAHHLGFLVPKNSRRDLNYANTTEVAADVQNLRKGYETCGNWTLPQACHHLTLAIIGMSKPATGPATPEQLQRQPALEQLLRHGKIPSGVESPAGAIPPPDSNESDIDAFLAALETVNNYNQPTATHRMFGPLTLDQYRRLALMHCAHHFSHFVPVTN